MACAPAPSNFVAGPTAAASKAAVDAVVGPAFNLASGIPLASQQFCGSASAGSYYWKLPGGVLANDYLRLQVTFDRGVAAQDVDFELLHFAGGTAQPFAQCAAVAGLNEDCAGSTGAAATDIYVAATGFAPGTQEAFTLTVTKSAFSCNQCQPFEDCTGGSACVLSPASVWNVTAASASFDNTKPNGTAWDVTGGAAPDGLVCYFDSPTEIADCTQIVTDVFAPQWGQTVKRGVTAAVLQSNTWSVFLFENDDAVQETVGGLTQVTEAALRSGYASGVLSMGPGGIGGATLDLWFTFLGKPCGTCPANQLCAPGGSCLLNPASRWDIVGASATFQTTQPGGSGWDLGGGAPDPQICWYDDFSGSAVCTAVVSDQFTANWNTIIKSNISAEQLTRVSSQAGLCLFDDDAPLGPDQAGCIYARFADADILAGQTVLTLVPAGPNIGNASFRVNFVAR